MDSRNLIKYAFSSTHSFHWLQCSPLAMVEMLKSIEMKRFCKKDRNLSLERMLTFIQHTEILKLCKALSMVNTLFLSLCV